MHRHYRLPAVEVGRGQVDVQRDQLPVADLDLTGEGRAGVEGGHSTQPSLNDMRVNCQLSRDLHIGTVPQTNKN